jgi:hypothetical protein
MKYFYAFRPTTGNAYAPAQRRRTDRLGLGLGSRPARVGHRRPGRSKGFRTAIPLGLLVAASVIPAKGAINIAQSVSDDINNQYFLTDITNNSGVDFDSGSLDYSQLFLDTANLSWNISKYDGENGGVIDGNITLSEFLPKAKTDGDVNFSLDNIGEVYDGWSGVIGNNGIVILTHLPGTPNLDYEPWNSTSTNANQDTMKTILGIDKSLYTNPSTNTIVPIDLNPSQTITGFASAKTGLNAFTADGQGYSVTAIPEPGAYAAMLGLFVAGGVAFRRYQKRKD